MDTALLMDPAFWEGPAVASAGPFPGALPQLPGISGHLLFQTSGSTAAPRWIAISKQALLISAAAVNRHLAVTPESRWGLALPLAHVGGMGVAARAFEAACELENFPGKWDPQRFAQWLGEKRITHTSLVPTQVHDLVAAGARAPEWLTAVVVGGGAMAEGIGRAARALGWPVLASYGMTEAASQIATQPLAALDGVYQSAPIPLLPIWDAGVTGEGLLQISGPALFSGTLTPSGSGWEFLAREGDFHLTADRVALEGRELTPLGRADARVKVLGELVDLEDLERRLIGRCGGSLRQGSFAVVAVRDPRAGSRLVLVAGPAADLDVLQRVGQEHDAQAAGFERLGPPLDLPELPVSPLGKVRRVELAALVESRLRQFRDCQ
jgi:o-succinylbenzoate---CoA ligase